MSHIAERTKYFAGRQWVFERVDEWLAASVPSRYFLLTGEPGSGKTALAGRLYQFSTGDFAPSGYDRLGLNWLGAVHFCSAGDANSVDPRAFATSIGLQLSARLQVFAIALTNVGDKTINIHVENNIGVLQANSKATGVIIQTLDVSKVSAQDAFNRIVIDPLLEIYQGGFNEPLTILVDSLDEAITHAGDVNIVKLLANLESLPAPVRFVLTSRRDDRVESRFTSADGFILSGAEFENKNRDDVKEYVTARIKADADLGKQLPDKEESFAETIATKAEENFQYATFILNAIARGEVPKTALEGLPPGLDALYHRSLERAVDLGKKDWASDYAPAMAVLAVAQEGLSLLQLQNLTGESEGSIWGCVMDLQQFIENRQTDGPAAETLYSLYHRSVPDFLHRRQIKLAAKSLQNRFYLSPSESHKKVADYYLGKTASAWDDYGLKYLATHLAAAASSSVGATRHGHVEALVSALADPEFRSEHLKRLHDLRLLQRDLQQSVKAAAQDSEPAGLSCVVESALALVDFRRKELRPEPIFERARAGDVDEAVQRLGLFDIDPEWQQIALEAIAWNALPANPPDAGRVRDRVDAMTRSTRVTRLLSFLDATLKGQPPPSRDFKMPADPRLEVGRAIVDRMGGSGADTELLMAHGIDPVRNPSMRASEGYLSQRDAPILLGCVIAFPVEGLALLRQYIALHTNYHYVVYRNRSLGFVLDSVLQHPDDSWIRTMTAELVCSALAGSRVDFQEALGLAVDFARAQDSQKIGALEMIRDQQLEFAVGLSNDRHADPLATCKRRLAALAEGFQLLQRPADSKSLIDAALNSRHGFAGFKVPACLSLAEAIEIASVTDVAAKQGALDEALRSAHNIQDGDFCARVTARTNAMRQQWWEQPFDVAATIERFWREPDAAEFCPIYFIGEPFVHRGSDCMELPHKLLASQNLLRLADAFHIPIAQMERVNPSLAANDVLETGTPVRIPDAGFATWLAARFAGAALANDALPPAQRVSLIRALAPIATPNPTTLDTVMARLVFASSPASEDLLDRIETAAKDSLQPPAVMDAALPA